MSPATPQRTSPSTRKKRDSPAKGRESPKKGRKSPTKQHLEVGQNGFYFSCELPMSKVTPKQANPSSRAGTPKKDRTNTPTTRTPSPPKAESAPKPSPVKELLLTSMKKQTPARDSSSVAVKLAAQNDTLPTKTKLTPKLVQELSSAPISTLRIPPECLIDVTAEEVAQAASAAPASESAGTAVRSTKPQNPLLSSQPTNIGHLMAGLRNATPKPLDAASEGGTTVSPAPTPLRRASDRLRLLAPHSFYTTANVRAEGISWDRLKNDSHALAPPKRSNLSTDSESQEKSLTESPLSEAKEKPLLTGSTAVQLVDRPIEHTPKVVQLANQPESSVYAYAKVSGRAAEHALRYEPLLFPKPEPDTPQTEQTSNLEKHVTWKESILPSSNHKSSQIPRKSKRVGTDPYVLEAMKEEMASVEAVMCASTGQPQGPVNNNELPVMFNAFSNNIYGDDKAASDHTSKPAQALSMMDFDTSSVCDGQVIAETNTPKRDAMHSRAVTVSPRALEKVSATARKEDVRDKKGKNTISAGPPPIRITSSAVEKLSKSSSKVASTSPRGASTTTRTSGVLHSGARTSTLHSKTPVTPMKKSIGASIPRSARRSIFDAPTPDKLVKPHASLRKALCNTPPHKAASIPANSAAPTPSAPVTDTRLSELKFASALDIAERISIWHQEDRERAAQGSPLAKDIINNTAKETQSADLKSEHSSCTPEGSPTKPASPLKHTKLRSTQSNSAAHSPAVTTPGSKKTAVPRMHDHGALQTPRNSKFGKPVALRTPRPSKFAHPIRTPSKAIQSSLDKAIDAQIAEDARAGREYTPGGNKVSDLLEAKKRALV